MGREGGNAIILQSQNLKKKEKVSHLIAYDAE